jgi:hypothetical protein
MNLGKILDLITENNINPDDVFGLVEKIKSSDMKDENNLRSIIREVSKMARKPIDKLREDQLVKKILSDGISEDLFGMI